MRSSHYRPTSRFNYRARCPARLLNWRSIRNNYTLLHRIKPSFPALMPLMKIALPFHSEARNGCVRLACLFIINTRTTQQRPRSTSRRVVCRRVIYVPIQPLKWSFVVLAHGSFRIKFITLKTKYLESKGASILLASEIKVITYSPGGTVIFFENNVGLLLIFRFSENKCPSIYKFETSSQPAAKDISSVIFLL